MRDEPTPWRRHGARRRDARVDAGRGVEEAWVPADSPEAEAFYAACGFVCDEEQPVQMTLRL
jgi:hypothetical protein